uniref:heat stress transcription factor A-3-like n=1 Tax=Erigeron canadensis TaxID=72917 RepID=UPI001CB89435|nr:heat stress transcription factor A-3-like [Erigeron canadensis]
MDPLYKRSLSSSSCRPLDSQPGSSNFPNSYHQPLPLPMDFGDDDDVVVIETRTGEGGVNVPRPLDCLQGTPIPPFLTKTYDLVDDPGLDPIISWGDTGASFIVWDAVEFSRTVLPKNFKHNNLSSFVRQLNTYGFRKIDTDRWEFASESFLRGKRHLLKNIHRRKSLQSHQVYDEGSTLSIEAEVEELHREKKELMREVIYLQQKQHGTHQFMESVNEKLQAAEDRQKQMVSSLAKVLQIPKFKKEHRRISSPKVRKYVKHQPYDQNCLLDPIPGDETVRRLDFCEESVPLQLHHVASQELAQIDDPIVEKESVFDLGLEATREYLISSPVNLVKQEDIWSSDFEAISAMPGSSNAMWNDVGSYDLPAFGVGGGELPDFWNLAYNGAENRPSDESETNQYGF